MPAHDRLSRARGTGGRSARAARSSRASRASGSSSVGSGRPAPDGHLDPHAVASVQRIMGKLPGMERQVVALRFGLSGGHPLSAADVAAELRLTPREVAEIERRGLERLRVLVPAEQLAALLARFRQ